jgi:hypothetical protein
MSYNRSPRRFDISGMWVEYLLILILVILVVIILFSLFGPYISNQVTQFLAELANNTAK